MTRQRDIELTIDGRTVAFYCSSHVDFEIESSLLENVNIWSCMISLKEFVAQRQAEHESNPSDLTLTVTPAERLPWEFSGNIMLTPIDGDWEAALILSTTIREEVTVASAIEWSLHRTPFSLKTLRREEDESLFVEGEGPYSWEVYISCNSREATFDELLVARRQISQAVFLPNDRIRTPYLALRMVQLGQLSALLGLQESEWLEVKSAPYDLKADSQQTWKLELAKDVAQFANSEIGGLLVIGLHTKRINGIDTIDRVTPFPSTESRLQSYRDVIKHRIHPPISGLQLDAVAYEKMSFIYIFVPIQKEENKPYLITGAVIDGRYENLGITIVRRQGDASIPVTAHELHSMIAAGRALLSGSYRKD